MTRKNRNPILRIGPGTIAMLVGIGAFGIYSYLSKPSEPKRVYYEADRAGKLVQVDRPSSNSPVPPPLFKPEPNWLLERATQLELAPSQVASIRKIGAGWTVAKSQFNDRFASTAKLASATDGKRLSAAGIRDSLGDYSALSREYDRQRQSSWDLSIAVLDAKQAARLEKLMEARR